MSSSKFPAFFASKCLQNLSIIQNNSVTISYPELWYLCKTHVALFARYLIISFLI